MFILSLLSVSQALLFTSEMFTFRLNLDIDDFGLSETEQQHIKHVTNHHLFRDLFEHYFKWCMQCFRDAELLKVHGSGVMAVYAINIAAQELGLYLLCLTTVYW